MNTTITQLKPGDKFSGALMVRSVETRLDKKGNSYQDVYFGDQSGEINGKIWAANPKLNAGDIVRIEGLIEEFQGRHQLRIGRCDPVSSPEDDTLRAQLIPSAPEPVKVMRDKIRETLASFRSEELRKLTTKLLNDAGAELNWFPAAQRMHHAELGGLLHHMTSMLTVAEYLCVAYPFLNRELLLAGVIIHDLAKIKEMKADSRFGTVSDYSRDGLLVGHINRGMADLSEAAAALGMAPDNELKVLLEHMILSHHGIPEYGSPRLPMFPEAEALHWIDTLDARMNQMQSVQDRTPPGGFSERIASMDNRRMYHPVFTADPSNGETHP